MNYRWIFLHREVTSYIYILFVFFLGRVSRTSTKVGPARPDSATPPLRDMEQTSVSLCVPRRFPLLPPLPLS